MARKNFTKTTKREAWERSQCRCEAPMCASPRMGRGRLCSVHHGRFYKKGNFDPPPPSRIEWLEEHATHDDARKCLLWPFGKDHGHYPSIKMGNRYSNAHREMCRIAHGAPPTESHFAVHSCDNKRCVNPNHLRWGTPAENVKEAFERGFIPKGENVSRAILTEELVRNARADRKSGMTYAELSRKYGIAKGAIWHAVKGSQWGHVK